MRNNLCWHQMQIVSLNCLNWGHVGQKLAHVSCTCVTSLMSKTIKMVFTIVTTSSELLQNGPIHAGFLTEINQSTPQLFTDYYNLNGNESRSLEI